jgi:hypothetical protein
MILFVVVLSAFCQPAAFSQTPQSLKELKELNLQLKKLYSQGKYNEAIPIAEKIRKLAEKAYGREHVDTAMALENLAEIYQKTGRNIDANKARQEAEAMRVKFKGKPTPAGVLESIKPAPPPAPAPKPAPVPPPPPAPAPAPDSTTKGEVPRLFWNLWAEPGAQGIQYDEIKQLEKGERYSVVLDLSAFMYPRFKLLGDAKPAASSLAEEVKKMLAGKKGELSLTAFLLPDTAYFAKPNDENIRKPMKIDLNKIRIIAGRESQPSSSPINWNDVDTLIEAWNDIESKKEKSVYVFGHAEFSLTTRKNCQDGWATVGIVLFHENRPIDEMKAVFCIGECKAEEKPKMHSRPSSFEFFTEKSQPPDGSLYLLELDRGKLVGLFCTESTAPGLPINCTNLDNDLNKASLDKQMKKIFSELSLYDSEKDLKRAGKTLMQNIFGDEIQPAYKKFKGFVREKIRLAGLSKKNPSLFVRIVTADGEVSPYIPYGLLLITAENALEEDFFLGQQFRVITPLPQRQSYAYNQSCVSNYVAFLPPEQTDNQPLLLGKRGMSDALEVLKAQKCVDISQIEGYLKNKTLISNPTILLIQSHHAEDRLYWTENKKPYIAPGDFLFRFGFPSIAILNACETSASDEDGFVKKLNTLGVDAVVATSSQVDGYMTGRFVFCLKKILKESKDKKALPLSQLFHDATVRCLWNEKNEPSAFKQPFQANALKYIILGNGDLQICAK